MLNTAIHEIKRTPAVKISRLTRAARRILHPQKQIVGWVHSCYDHTINIAAPNGRLLTLQGEGLLKAPLALSLKDKIDTILPIVHVGAVVAKDGFTDTHPLPVLNLNCSKSEDWDGRMFPLPSLEGSRLWVEANKLETWLLKYHHGSGLARLLPISSGLQSNLSPALEKLLSVLEPFSSNDLHLSQDSFQKMTSQIVGLGEGLTPSGDDFLVGLLMVLHMTGRIQTLLPSSSHSSFLKNVKAQTSDLSAEFICSAVEGYFSEPLVLLARSLFARESRSWRLHAGFLASIGHSSGIDVLVGVIFGCRLISRSTGYQHQFYN